MTCAMRQNLPFYYLPDMDFGAKDVIFVLFFGVQAATLAMCGRLAKITRAKVCLCIAEMTDTGYTVHISQPWKNYPTGDDTAESSRISTSGRIVGSRRGRRVSPRCTEIRGDGLPSV